LIALVAFFDARGNRVPAVSASAIPAQRSSTGWRWSVTDRMSVRYDVRVVVTRLRADIDARDNDVDLAAVLGTVGSTGLVGWLQSSYVWRTGAIVFVRAPS
jgi:hypothetical protein